jgi:N-carbamoylputrescine amidase
VLSHRGHAVANGLPVLSCNRVGHEPSPLGASGIEFWGNSHVLRGPAGRVHRRIWPRAASMPRPSAID